MGNVTAAPIRTAVVGFGISGKVFHAPLIAADPAVDNTGDSELVAARVAEAARVAGYDLTPLHLFPMPNVEDIEATVLDHDVVWVGGGSVANLLAVWRVHAVDDIMRRAWRAGVVLARRAA